MRGGDAEILPLSPPGKGKQVWLATSVSLVALPGSGQPFKVDIFLQILQGRL